MRIFLTGASGFIGTQLVRQLSAKTDCTLKACVRKKIELPEGVRAYQVNDIGKEHHWSAILSDIDVVIHLAGYTHLPPGLTCEKELFRINTEGSIHLARQAAESGVKRFIFISSIKIHGNESGSHPFMVSDIPKPVGPYAQSKWQTEQALLTMLNQYDMETVIIRPPLVYGYGAAGNFGQLVHWLKAGIPLPLGSVHNRRSLVALDNLVDLLITCIDHPAAANQTFLVSDGEDLSTTELLRRLGQAMGKPTHLLPIPVPLLQWGAALLGKKAVAQKLLGSLQVDITATCNTLGWQPPISVDEGLQRCFPKQKKT